MFPHGERIAVVCDLGYGDAGKGAFVDFLARQTDGSCFVVRNNGGPQASHNVITPDGKHHCFRTIGSGHFAGARTLLGPGMFVNFEEIDREIRELNQLGYSMSDSYTRLYIHESCFVLTPVHAAINQLREELRGENKHGSCGYGIGEIQRMRHSSTADTSLLKTTSWVRGSTPDDIYHWLRILAAVLLVNLTEEFEVIPQDHKIIKYLHDDVSLKNHAEAIYRTARCCSLISTSAWHVILESDRYIIFEGAQGVLLDETFGFAPYTTWSDTTTWNIWDMMQVLDDSNSSSSIHRYGLMRSYMTRHGAGPFITHVPGMADKIPAEHNHWNKFQEDFKAGWLDLVAIRYALDVCANIDSLVVSHCDTITKLGFPIRVANLYHTMDQTHSVINNIAFNEEASFESMCVFTEAYMKMKPIYDTVNNVDELLAYIESHTGYRISVTSWGPTHIDRKVLQRV